MNNRLFKNQKIITVIKLIAYVTPLIFTLYVISKNKWYDNQIDKLRNQRIENRRIKLINHQFIKNFKFSEKIIIKKNFKLTKNLHCNSGIENRYISCIKNKNENIWSVAYTNNHTLCASMYTNNEISKFPFTDDSFRSHCPTFFKKYFYQLYKINTWENTMKADNTDLRSGAFIWSLYLSIFQSHPMKVFYEEVQDGIIALTHDLYGGSQLVYIYYNGQVFNVKFKNQISPDDPLPVVFDKFIDNNSTDYTILNKLTGEK